MSPREKYEAPELAGQAAPHGVLDGRAVSESPVPLHRVDELAVHRDFKGAAFPRDQLDAGETRTELEHERFRESQRLGLVTALGAVGDLDLVRRGHAATRVAISRSSRTTSAFANFVVSSRIFASSPCRRTRTSSGRASTGASGETNSGCAAKISFRRFARISVTDAGRSIQWPSSRKSSSKKTNTGIDLNCPLFR